MITICSAPKPFVDSHISIIQHNAIRSWLALGDQVEVLLLGDEPGIEEAAIELAVPLFPLRSRAPSGAPLISEMFQIARDAATYHTLCYVNADIILLDDFLPAVEMVEHTLAKYLMVGNRWDMEIEEELSIEEGWIATLRRRMRENGKLHPPMGSDYFVFRHEQFKDIPAFALGRAGWDNWMMYKARHEGIPVVDASAVITVVHQAHDYAHLPGGEPHYRHAESDLNIELAGGYETMFRLRDANWLLSYDGLRQKGLADWEWPRKIEADWIAKVGAGFAARFIRMLFHPRAAIAYLRHKMRGSNPGKAHRSSRERESRS